MCEFLFKVQQKNRLEQKGLLKRFSIKCYGKQSTLGDMREEKAKKYHELKEKRGSKEWNEWFLRYIPNEIEEKTVSKKKTQRKTQKKKEKTKKTKKTKNNKFFNYFNQ